MKKVNFFLGAFLAISLTGCFSDYSEGERVGSVSKFSKKGIIFKTYEGELLLGGLKNSDKGFVANTFEFSLDSEKQRGENLDQLIDSINFAMNNGHRVKIHYSQEIRNDLNSSRGDTEYYVTKVEILR